MKFNVKREPEKFSPIKLEVTLETKDELERWWALFNHTGILRFFGVNAEQSPNSQLPFARNDKIWDQVINMIND